MNAPVRTMRILHPRLDPSGKAISAIPAVLGRWDADALGLLTEDPAFNFRRFAWVGTEQLGDDCHCVAIHTALTADSPYLWITKGQEDPAGFLLCLYADGAGAEDPFLVSECAAEELAAEVLGMLDSASRRAGNAPGTPRGIEVEVSDDVASALIGRAGLRREGKVWVAADGRRTSARPEALLWALARIAEED